ncbi:MAG: hypothetical protein ACI8QF_002224 [Limisphaerales bacterium]
MSERKLANARRARLERRSPLANNCLREPISIGSSAAKPAINDISSAAASAPGFPIYFAF